MVLVSGNGVLVVGPKWFSWQDSDQGAQLQSLVFSIPFISSSRLGTKLWDF